MLHYLIAGAIALAAPQQSDTTFTVRPNGRLEVDAYAGTVTVRSWDRQEVRVQATSSRSRTDFEIEHRGNTVSIDASDDHGTRDQRFTITVPRSFRVAVDCVECDIDIADVDAEVSAETVDGDVTLRSINGRVQAESVSGDIIIETVKGDVEVSATNQNIRMSNITGDIEADATNGFITMLGIVSSNVSVETVNGEIVLGSTIRDGGSYSVSTTNGAIIMGVPDGTNATFDVSTYTGSLDTAIPLTTDRKRRGEYSMHIGSGSASVSIESFAGNVRLVRPAELKDIAASMKSRNRNRDRTH